MNFRIILFLCIFLFGSRFLCAADVVVIAHSVSTRMEARNVLARLKWREVHFKKASGVLVVCRSALLNPLQQNYNSIVELDQDAENQLNIAGFNFHVYIFQIENDLSVKSVKHFSYRAD